MPAPISAPLPTSLPSPAAVAAPAPAPTAPPVMVPQAPAVATNARATNEETMRLMDHTSPVVDFTLDGCKRCAADAQSGLRTRSRRGGEAAPSLQRAVSRGSGRSLAR